MMASRQAKEVDSVMASRQAKEVDSVMASRRAKEVDSVMPCKYIRRDAVMKYIWDVGYV